MMKHIYLPGKDASKPTLLLLHGTGGTERDLLPLAAAVDGDAAVLSVRGNVLENGLPRFFRRLAEGVFDIEDLEFRTKELDAFLNDAAAEYGFDRSNVWAIGYSNGANIAASLLFHIAGSLRGAMLHHPMVPRRDIALPDLAGMDTFIAAGRNDPLCTPQESVDLQQLLTDAGANVELYWEDNGHQLSRTEVTAAAQWYESKRGTGQARG